MLRSFSVLIIEMPARLSLGLVCLSQYLWTPCYQIDMTFDLNETNGLEGRDGHVSTYREGENPFSSDRH